MITGPLDGSWITEVYDMWGYGFIPIISFAILTSSTSKQCEFVIKDSCQWLVVIRVDVCRKLEWMDACERWR